MRPLLVLISLGAVAAAPAQGLAQRVPASLAGLPKSEIEVVTDTGTHLFKVWVAADDASRARGLMGIKRLPEAHGMLFMFERPQLASFWIKNTYVPHDLAFIDFSGVVVNIAVDARPLSRGEPIKSVAPAGSVLELAAGAAAVTGAGAAAAVTGTGRGASGCEAQPATSQTMAQTSRFRITSTPEVAEKRTSMMPAGCGPVQDPPIVGDSGLAPAMTSLPTT